MKTGIELIAIERQEQIEKHGFVKEHDKDFSDRELINTALYLLTGIKSYFPRWWDEKYYLKFKAKLENSDKIEAYKIAGALIAAEIDRIQNQ